MTNKENPYSRYTNSVLSPELDWSICQNVMSIIQHEQFELFKTQNSNKSFIEKSTDDTTLTVFGFYKEYFTW